MDRRRGELGYSSEASEGDGSGRKAIGAQVSQETGGKGDMLTGERGDSIVRKTDRVLNKGDHVVVCLPGAKIEAITERVENIVGSGKGGSV